MKKFYLLLLVICISSGVMAQRGKVTSALSFIEQGALDKAKEALEQAYVHEKSKDWFNTYFAKGRFCQAVYQTDDPKFSAYCTDPLEEAYAAYEKAISLDPKGNIKKRIITNMVYNSLALDLYSQGSDRFEASDFAGALKSFATQIEITESDKYAGAVDTGMYYNAGLAAINSEKYEDAIKYFQKCADMVYMGITPYLQVYESYMGLGDTTRAENYLLDLPNKFPGDNQVILQLIDFYLKADRPEQAQKYITMAKEADPDNYSLYFAAGIMYLNQNIFDEAIAELTKSIELKDDLYDTQYGLGAAYINKAADMFLKANDIMDVNEYTQAVEDANSEYAKAMPYMERALELKPDDVYALRSLQELYYRLRQKDASLNEKYEQTRARLSELEQ
ncbi:MAG: tetratricopeptide repeat protein [Bacteroidales bacterium]|nr:tetratricopeptide repeat protein [Bacteroidales bacterium]